MNEFPDVDSYNIYKNPTLTSPNCPYELPFYQTKESLLDIETYKRFLENAISRFRHSIRYKHYKGYLYDIGLDHCQFNGNITAEMASLEMHHCIITIYDIAILITEHILQTKGYISTFDLVQLLKEEHKNNNIALVMLTVTNHQLEHNVDEFYISPRMCFGKWWEFCKKYHKGLEQCRDISLKIIFYLRRAMEKGDESDDVNLLEVYDSILDWSDLNSYYKIK